MNIVSPRTTNFRMLASRAELKADPTEHCVVTGIVREPDFKALISRMPQVQDMEVAVGAAKYSNKCQEGLNVAAGRYDLWLFRASHSPQNGAVHDDWSDFASEIVAPDTIELLRDRFCVPLGLCKPHETLIPYLRMVTEVGACWLHPHLDRPEKVLTVVFYLRCDPETGARGTSLYTQEGGAKPVVCHEVEFLPNSALILPRTETSLHGVEPHRCGKGRTTMHLYLSRRADSH